MPAQPIAAPRRRFGPAGRKLALTIHVGASVALLGTTASTLILGLRAAVTDDPELARATYRLMEMLSFALNIPLSIAALVSGIVIGLGTKWGVLRHWWVTTKLALLIAVVAVGALVVGRGIGQLLDASPGAEPASVRWRVVAGAATALVALMAATALSVYKPGGRFRPRRVDAAAARSSSG